jgi:transcription elongation GreA/GreB family factor
MIFAREISDSLTSLVKQIDKATLDNASARMGSFVVFLNDDDKLEKQLKALADKEDIKETVLTIDNPAGPSGYKIAKDAEVTVVLYTHRNVKSNHAYHKGELNDKAIADIVADIPKILPEGKKQGG